MFTFSSGLLFIYSLNKIIEVSDKYILVSSKRVLLDIRGVGLVISSFEDKEISIKGRVDSISMRYLNG
jgi:hypothetical protein